MNTSGSDEATGMSLAELDQLHLSLRSTKAHDVTLSKSEAQVILDKVWKVRWLMRYTTDMESP